MNLLKTILILTAGSQIIAACSSSRDLPTVDQVDLGKYEGTWYDIAHLPRDFEEDCKCITVQYFEKPDYVKVVNSCVDKKDRSIRMEEGKAIPEEGSGNSVMKVQFFWPVKGDYHIIALEEDYSYAMVGSPDRESLWILSRRPEPAAIVLKEYLNKAESLGFKTSNLKYTDQSCHVQPIER